jgi:D-arabinose 5-phosphate isomerase GutQ
MEELEHALKKYNMGDEKTIREIIAEVDTDNVCFFLLSSLSFSKYTFFVYHFPERGKKKKKKKKKKTVDYRFN